MRNDFLKLCTAAMTIAILALVPAVRAQQQQEQPQVQGQQQASQRQSQGLKELRAGTPISVVLNQSLSSKSAKVGQKVEGRVAAAVVVGGKTVIPKGARVNLSVASVQAAAPQSGPAKLMLQLDSIVVNGRLLTASAGLAGRTEKPLTQPDDLIHGDSTSGSVVASSGSDNGELVGASANASSAGSVRRDVSLAAQTRLGFTLRSDLQLQ